MNEPIFERTFIYDSYACRKGKGTHAAAARVQQFCRRYDYALQCDVQQYFPGIDHEILLSLLARKIKCKQTMGLTKTIIEHNTLIRQGCAVTCLRAWSFGGGLQGKAAWCGAVRGTTKRRGT